MHNFYHDYTVETMVNKNLVKYCNHDCSALNYTLPPISFEPVEFMLDMLNCY